MTTVANCASCHGAHGILPSSDPDSTVYKGNLPRTCGKCHQNAGMMLAKGSVHLSPSLGRDKAVFFVTWLYIILIGLTVCGMLAHNILYSIPKIREHYRRHKEKAKYTRFTKIERIQHVVLLTSFIILAYTGFALRFRSAWWAAPFTVWNPGFDWRGIIHRVAAAVFGILAVYHIYYLSCTKRGRAQLKALLPQKKDIFYFIRVQINY